MPGLEVVTHVILGLPGESREDMLATVDYLGRLGTDGIKLQLLHILKGTKLAVYYEAAPFHIFTLEEYANLICDCIRILPPSVVIHRHHRRRAPAAAHRARVERRQAEGLKYLAPA